MILCLHLEIEFRVQLLELPGLSFILQFHSFWLFLLNVEHGLVLTQLSLDIELLIGCLAAHPTRLGQHLPGLQRLLIVLLAQWD